MSSHKTFNNFSNVQSQHLVANCMKNYSHSYEDNCNLHLCEHSERIAKTNSDNRFTAILLSVFSSLFMCSEMSFQNLMTYNNFII